MAIKLSTDQIVRTFRPNNGTTFTIDELNDSVGGWVEPVKVGPVWLMYREKSKEKNLPLNDLASFFFDVAVYGEAIVVPPQQLPMDWDLMEDSDRYVTSDMVDNGFLLSLQNALAIKKMRDENPGLIIEPAAFFNSQFNIRPKAEYVYEPPQGVELDASTEDFFKQVYDYISKAPAQFKKGVLLEDAEVIIRTEDRNKKEILGLIKVMYLENEEYEKCAVLQKLEESFV